jgi:hypothetical protein
MGTFGLGGFVRQVLLRVRPACGHSQRLKFGIRHGRGREGHQILGRGHHQALDLLKQSDGSHQRDEHTPDLLPRGFTTTFPFVRHPPILHPVTCIPRVRRVAGGRMSTAYEPLSISLLIAATCWSEGLLQYSSSTSGSQASKIGPTSRKRGSCRKWHSVQSRRTLMSSIVPIRELGAIFNRT